MKTIITSISMALCIIMSGCQSSFTEKHAATAIPDSTAIAQKFQQDRAAILAMAGSFEVNFNFEETLAIRSNYELSEPYQSGGTEWVTVLEDSGERIVLQHVLVACDKDSNAPILEDRCFPIKHWRQDWVYQDTQLFVFKSDNVWEKQTLAAEEVAGSWSQAVYQVDDSPRYEGYGHWQHEANQSVWQSETTWRPLPRREYTHRDDYDVLVAVNKHIVTANGWYHEQDNYKLDLQRNTAEPVIAREYGFNSYLPAKAPELVLASDYMHETEIFWETVRNWWEHNEKRYASLQIKSSYSDRKMYEAMFELADNYRSAGRDEPGMQTRIDETLQAYLTVIKP